jgi:predicted Zn-dependent protease
MLLAVLLASCQTIDLNQITSVTASLGDAVSLKGEEEEQEVGAQAANVLLGAAEVVEDEDLQRYVNRVGHWVALHSDRPELPWTFAVLNDGDINAFAAPGGYVFITAGLLARMRSEAELAGVLGHEIGHVTEKHHLKAIRKEARLKIAGVLAAAALESEGHDSDRYVALADGAKTIYTRGLDRGDEYEADRIGVVLAARAGYDPYGLPAVLQTLDSLNADSSALALMTATHPAPQSRLEKLDKAMSAQTGQFAGGKSGSKRFRAEMTRLTR